MNEYTTPAPVSAGELGPLARLLRKERGVTLEQASSELGVTISALSRAERGELSVYRLALRSANAHLERLAADERYLPGKVEERIQVVGGGLMALAKLRGPEMERRAALLRQALMARKVSVEQESRFVLIRLAEDALMVDLPTMTVFAWLGRPDATINDTRGRAYGGCIVTTDDLVDGLSVEEWALAVDRFAEALVSASAGRRLDLAALRSSDAEALHAATVSRRAPSSTTGEPMEQ